MIYELAAHTDKVILRHHAEEDTMTQGEPRIETRSMSDHDAALEDLADPDILAEWHVLGIIPEPVRRYWYSPLMVTREDMMDVAYEVADIIERHGRKSLWFDILSLSYDPDFIPDCKTQDLYLDTGSYSRQVGLMDRETVINVVETKKHCLECPLRRECLAVSMTAPQLIRSSKEEKTLPIHRGDEPLVLSEYLMYGGFTPQERREIFFMVCDILQEKDSY